MKKDDNTIKDIQNLFILKKEDKTIKGRILRELFEHDEFITYADLECLTEKNDGCKNNPEKSSKTKVSEHIPLGISMPTISSFKRIKNKHDTYRGKDCMKKFCKFLREHAMKIINFKKKKMKSLTKERQKSYQNAKILLYL